jgi:hypothetical protein
MMPEGRCSALIPLTALFLCLGCASMSSLPQSAAEADFASPEVGKTGWSEYQDAMTVNGIDRQTAFLAAKEGLSYASFVVKRGR